MITHSLQQGSPEWHQHRATHMNASDAPAMMGVSPYQTRTELLHQRSTGITPDIDEATQRRFDDGHRFEALARTLAEQIIGEDLYPVTVSTGRYSASMDGLNMAEDQSFEHKSLNDSIRAATCAHDLPEYLRVQMEHQFIASPGTTRCLFMASKWDNEGTLLEKKHFWYEPDLDLRARIIAGWEQFERDLAEHAPFVHTEKPEPDAVMQLPALSIQTSGSISIISNLDLFGKKLSEFVDALDLEPSDDQGFANAEAAVKTLQKAQDALEAAESNALAQASSVDEMRRTVALYAETARKTRLMLEKMVKARKEQIKGEIVSKAKETFYEHVFALEAEVKPIRFALIVKQPDLIGAAKNKRTLASLHDAINTELANGKIAADALAKEVRTKLAWHNENAKGYEFLFADLQSIIQKPTEDFQMLVKNRIDQHKADEKKKLDDERVRIAAEEKKKAEDKVRADLLAEQLAAAQAVVSQPTLVAVTPQTPTAEAPKPTTDKSAGSVNRDIPTRVDPLMLTLARRDAEAFRTKFASIGGLSRVHAEIGAFLAATTTEEHREAVEA